MWTNRTSRLSRKWSNSQLRRLSTEFSGDVVNASGWDDRDKEGGHYRDYFARAASYKITNYSGDRGIQGLEGEIFLDLTEKLPKNLERKFDVVFNHTTLEHIFDVRTAFQNLCMMSRDVVIVVVPFVQVQHETQTWKDYWRFTPTCLRELFRENGLQVVYEAQNNNINASTYIFSIGARNPSSWSGRLPRYEPIHRAGQWVGASLIDRLRVMVQRLRV